MDEHDEQMIRDSVVKFNDETGEVKINDEVDLTDIISSKSESDDSDEQMKDITGKDQRGGDTMMEDALNNDEPVASNETRSLAKSAKAIDTSHDKIN